MLKFKIVVERGKRQITQALRLMCCGQPVSEDLEHKQFKCTECKRVYGLDVIKELAGLAEQQVADFQTFVGEVE